jgi:1-acyl-sn-glycerol-3-phosphate acyltransferase
VSIYTESPRQRRRKSTDARVVKAQDLPVAALGRRVRRLQRKAPAYALMRLNDLSSRLRDMTGREVIDMNRVMGAMQFVYRLQQLAQRGADYEVDEFGFDPEWTEALLPVFGVLYHDYWRVETTGIENVPSSGRGLLVSNHAGVLPWDGTMIKTAVIVEHPHPRHVRALVASLFMGMPMLSWFLRRTGQTVGHPDDTRRLLERDQLVLVFPEGVRGTGKLYAERYKLRRFGRGGFVSTAIRAGAPIVPISVVGSEEIYPMIGDVAPVARAFGLPYFPVTPLWPWLGPLGMIPLPSKWRIQFHPVVHTEEYPPEAADDQNLVMTLSDRVRDTIQQGIYDNLKLRRGTFV